MLNGATNETRFLRIEEVAGFLNVSRRHIYKMMQVADFPKPIKLGPQAARWRSDEVEAWIASRPRGTMNAAA